MNALVVVAITIAAYLAARALYLRVRHPLLHPIGVAIVALTIAARLTHRTTADVEGGGRGLTLLLGPSVVALGVGLHHAGSRLRRALVPIAATTIVGAVTGLFSGVLLARLFGLDAVTRGSIAPKSVTTPIAVGVSAALHGDPRLTACLVMVAGAVGATAGPPLLRVLGVTDPEAWGLAMGTAAHGIGTARALEESPLHGAAAGLAIALQGVAVPLLAPLVMRLFA